MSENNHKNRRVGLLFITLEESTLHPKKVSPVLHLEQRPVPQEGEKVSWPGIAMVTVGSKIKENEEEATILVREMCKKFQPMLAYHLIGILIQNGMKQQILFENSQMRIYYLVVSKQTMEHVYPQQKVRIITLTSMNILKLIEVEKEWKHQPHNLKDKIPVFPEVKAAIMKAVNELKLQKNSL